MKKVLVMVLVFAMLFSVTVFAEKGGNGNGNAYGLEKEKENNAAWSRFTVDPSGCDGAGSIDLIFEKKQFTAIVENNGSLSNGDLVMVEIYEADMMIKVIELEVDGFFELTWSERTVAENGVAGVRMMDFANTASNFDVYVGMGDLGGADRSQYQAPVDEPLWVNGDNYFVIHYIDGVISVVVNEKSLSYDTEMTQEINEIGFMLFRQEGYSLNGMKVNGVDIRNVDEILSGWDDMMPTIKFCFGTDVTIEGNLHLDFEEYDYESGENNKVEIKLFSN